MNVIGNSIEVYKNMAKSATQDSINYKKRIDKAIEELERLSKLYEDNYTISDKAKDIIDILKGSDKE